MIYSAKNEGLLAAMNIAGMQPAETSVSKYVKYKELAAAFDIETTSLRMEDGSKAACMYVWQFAVEDVVVIGRTWEEYKEFYNNLVNLMPISDEHRLVVYVHNLAFEMAFLAKRHEWLQVFAMQPREPLYMTTVDGVEFRCSYRLSGLSLAKVGEGLRHPIAKLEGDLDYDKPRHSGTPLTDQELEYCIHDVEILIQYIRECMEDEGSITRIPLTKTGYVRRYARHECINDNPSTRTPEQWEYVRLMKRLQLDAREYQQLKRAFQGGFTHANAWNSNKVFSNVTSYDFTSSYPTVMISEQYPMSRGRRVNVASVAELDELCTKYCVMFDVMLQDVVAKTQENYISLSRCHPGTVSGAVENNGRLVSADQIATTLTDVDWDIVKRTYDFGRVAIANVVIYERGYLPTPFVRCIVGLYKAKTELKNVGGKEQEYQVAKGMLNSLFGMCVTDICREIVSFDGEEWTTRRGDLLKELSKENASFKRFLFYPWGVWITAYARRALWTGILECGGDYIYSDTDSIKILHAEDHADYIEKYNQNISARLEKAMLHHGLDPRDLAPCSVDGKPHPLGVWDYEGTYDEFKTLGAKRYLTRTGSRYALTVAGLGKRAACSWFASQDDPFAMFRAGVVVPAEATGKKTHTYIDHEKEGEFTDYLGNRGAFHELSSVHLEAAAYHLSIGDRYEKFLEELCSSNIIA